MQTEQKNIYIYNFFPYPKVSSLNAANPSEHRLWGAHCSNSWDEQVPAKATAFLTHGVGTMDGMEWGKVRERERGRKNEQERRNRYALKKMGQLGHTHGELVDFIYWFLTFSFWFILFLFPPFPSPTMVEKPHSGGEGLIRPAQSLQSTPGWPIVACGGASQSSHRQASPAD